MGTARIRRVVTLVKWLTAAVAGSILVHHARTPCIITPQQGQTFAIDLERDSFTLHGKPMRILSGSIHYFRTPPELWLERLTYARAAGLNTIDTFVEWSSHEPEEGHFDFQGQQDIVAFLETAHRLGFMVILRPGPYIGAERDMGGLPYWLLRNGSDVRLRTMDERYIRFADRYLVELFKRVRHLLIKNGGPIIMFQVESRYSQSEECDYAYLQHLRDLMRKELGRNTVLFTTHSVKTSGVSCGRIEGVFAAIAFGTGTNVSEAFAIHRGFQKRGPLFVSELYTGWYDQWMMPHHHVKSREVAKTLREVLASGGSVNLYMFHGGTSFGFTAGASMVDGSKPDDAEYRPMVTSYDFDAPLTEAGDPTKKFSAVRDVIAELSPLDNLPEEPVSKQKMNFGPIVMNHMFGLEGLRFLATKVSSTFPLTFEQVDYANGLMFYDVKIPVQPHWPSWLVVNGIRDEGYVHLDDEFIDTLSHMEKKYEIVLKAKINQVLTILVHNQGRISAGNSSDYSKGIIGNVTLNRRVLTNWTMRPVPLTNASWLTNYIKMRVIQRNMLARAADNVSEVRFHAARFKLPTFPAQDTFLKPDRMTKGIAFLNGFNLGRYWPRGGPQETLYVPRTLFTEENVLVLVELEGGPLRRGRPCVVHFVLKAELNGTVEKASHL